VWCRSDRCHGRRRNCSPDSPKSGQRTREQLKRMAGDVKDKAEDYYDEMKDKATEATEKVRLLPEAKHTVDLQWTQQKRVSRRPGVMLWGPRAAPAGRPVSMKPGVVGAHQRSARPHLMGSSGVPSVPLAVETSYNKRQGSCHAWTSV